MSKIQDITGRISDKIHQEVKDLNNDEYKDVLENLYTEIQGRLESLEMEEEDED